MNDVALKGSKDPGPLAKVAIDLGPLVAYFAAYALTKNVILATAVFMVATAGSILASKLLHGRVSAMLWFSGVMVLVLGGLTVWLKDATFIKMKPTVYYLLVAGILGFGLWTDRPTLKMVLGSSFPGLSDLGWRKLTRNWAFFFVAMAVANEAVWRTSTTEFWLGYKLWGAMPATMIFMLANLPMLSRHGFSGEKPEDVSIPPQG